jgi:hypothetical protein
MLRKCGAPGTGTHALATAPLRAARLRPGAVAASVNGEGQIGGVAPHMRFAFASREGRGAGALAAFLSSLFPGLGQLYNGDRGKAAVMMLLAAGVATMPLQLDVTRLDLDALVRQVLLPSLALCALVLWSIVDAYRAGRRRVHRPAAGPSSAS